jgi:probable HAF family extracellular repeat protein
MDFAPLSLQQGHEHIRGHLRSLRPGHPKNNSSLQTSRPTHRQLPIPKNLANHPHQLTRIHLRKKFYHDLQKIYLFFLVILFAILPLLLAASAKAEVRYTITDLGALDDNYSIAYGINDAGGVVGYSYLAGDGYATKWVNGQPVNLINRSSSLASAISNNGQVVGFYENAQVGATRRAFLFDGSNFTDLGSLGNANPTSEANGINDFAQVVGYSDGHAFVWQNGVMSPLAAVGGGSYGCAYNINNSSQIVGYSLTASSQQHATLWNGNSAVDLGTLGGSSSEAYDINEASQIVGFSDIENGLFHGFISQNGVMVDLGTLGGDISYAAAINDSAQIVGASDSILDGSDGFGTDLRACLWENNQAIDLNTLIDPNSGWFLMYAHDINNQGMIVGKGMIDSEQHAFLMTAIPEPCSLLLMLVGLFTALRSRRN